MRYIDAENIEYTSMCRARGNGMYEDCEIAHKDQIDDIPTADVVEVVRCKDCKWRYSTSDCTHWLPCMDIIYNNDFYCGYGERADE